jgi:hypothetical protein
LEFLDDDDDDDYFLPHALAHRAASGNSAIPRNPKQPEPHGLPQRVTAAVCAASAAAADTSAVYTAAKALADVTSAALPLAAHAASMHAENYKQAVTADLTSLTWQPRGISDGAAAVTGLLLLLLLLLTNCYVRSLVTAHSAPQTAVAVCWLIV